MVPIHTASPVVSFTRYSPRSDLQGNTRANLARTAFQHYEHLAQKLIRSPCVSSCPSWMEKLRLGRRETGGPAFGKGNRHAADWMAPAGARDPRGSAGISRHVGRIAG